MLDEGSKAAATQEIRTAGGRILLMTSAPTSANLGRFASRRIAQVDGFQVRSESREQLVEAEAIRVVFADAEGRTRVHYYSTFAGCGWDVGIALDPHDLRDGIVDFEETVSRLRLGSTHTAAGPYPPEAASGSPDSQLTTGASRHNRSRS